MFDSRFRIRKIIRFLHGLHKIIVNLIICVYNREKSVKLSVKIDVFLRLQYISLLIKKKNFNIRYI